MSKIKIWVYVEPNIHRQLKQTAIQRSSPRVAVSMSSVASQMLTRSLSQEAEQSLDNLLGVRLEGLLRQEIREQYSGIRRLLARACIEANATRRLLTMHIEDQRGAEYAKELSNASYLAAVEAIRKTSSELEAALAAVMAGSGPSTSPERSEG